MSYYDFDEHFWSAKSVCAQSKLPTSQPKTTNKTVLKILSVLCIAISSGLLLNVFGLIGNNHPDASFIQTNNSSSNCLFLQGNAKMQVYCSQLE
jgi:hypothetical protein